MTYQSTTLRSIARLRACTQCWKTPKSLVSQKLACHHSSTGIAPALTASTSRRRPRLSNLHQSSTFSPAVPPTGRRTIFIQTESTPNVDVGWRKRLVEYRMLILSKGLKVPAQPPHLTPRTCISIPGISQSEVHPSATTSIATRRTAIEH